MRSTPALTLHSNMWNGMTARSYIISYSFDYFAWSILEEDWHCVYDTFCLIYGIISLKWNWAMCCNLKTISFSAIWKCRSIEFMLFEIRYICLIENPKIMWCMAFKWRNMDIIIANVHLGEPQNAQFTIHCDSHNHSH